MSGGSSSGWRRSARERHRARSRSTPSSRKRPFSIAFTAPPSRQCGCSCSAWPARPGDVDRAVDGAAAGGPDLERARLGDDREVGGHAVARAGEPADAAGLLVGVGAHHDVTAQRAALGEHLGSDDHRRDPALHVARAAADDPAVGDQRVERVVLQPSVAPRRHDVDVPVQQQRPPAAAAAQPRGELRPTGEADARRRSAGGPRRPPAPAPTGRSRRPPPQPRRPATPAARPRRAPARRLGAALVSNAISSQASATSSSRRSATRSTSARSSASSIA